MLKINKNIMETNKFSMIIYVIISFIIVTYFTDKFIFMLDSPKIDMDINLFYGKIVPVYGGYIPFALTTTFPTLFQKLLLFSTFFLSGYFMHILSGKLISNKIGFYAGFLYMINPFTYIRILTGQWYISYATIPLLLYIFINLLENKKNIEKIKFIFVLSIISINIHMLIIALITIFIILLFWFSKYRDIRISKVILLSIIPFILLNSYWIIPILSAKNTIANNITDKDLEAYAPKGTLFDIAAMYGFWREGYIYAKDFIPGWQILYLIILLLAIIGFLAYYKDEKIGYIVKAIGVIGIVGFILASGIKGPFGDQIYWLFDNTILKGFRDSHKFVSMMVLAYAMLGGLGVNKIKMMI